MNVRNDVRNRKETKLYIRSYLRKLLYSNLHLQNMQVCVSGKLILSQAIIVNKDQKRKRLIVSNTQALSEYRIVVQLPELLLSPQMIMLLG